MEHLNLLLFSVINASDPASAIAVAIARLAAQWLVFVPAAVVTGLWIWGAPRGRGELLAAGLGLLVGMTINQMIGELWFHPRPFMLGVGHTLMFHVPENSFPSDHATFLWSVGFALIALGSWRPWGWCLVIVGLLVAWARIYLGLHFPMDMAGSLIVSLIAASVAWGLRPVVERRLLSPTEAFYELLLERFRLPPARFPRKSDRL